MRSILSKQTMGKDNCAYWENFLTEEELRYIEYHQAWRGVDDASVGGSSGQGEVNKDIRRTDVAWLGFEPENNVIWDKVTEAIAEVNARFFHAKLTACTEPMQLTKYTAETKGHYDWHMDGAPQDRKHPRKLSMVLMLSHPSEYEGGHLQIKTGGENTTLETKRGRAWFFPSYILHRVTPVTKGVRKTVVLWAGGPEWT